MKRFSFLPVILLVCFFTSCRHKPLTEDQKVNDFLYLYETLEANYPYFHMGKQKSGIDWLANKDTYLDNVRATSTDSAYAKALEEILTDLRNGHVDLSPTFMYDMYAKVFDEIKDEYPEYIPWQKTLENAKPNIYYWIPFFDNSGTVENSNENSIRSSNYKDTLISDKRIAVMEIPSFERDFMEMDIPHINNFLDNLDNVDYLILDIQGNGGGSEFYWRDLIVSRLIQDTITYNKIYALKNGSVNKKYYSKVFDNYRKLSPQDPFNDSIPQEFQNKRFQIFEETITISPDNPVNFRGKIFLLVDKFVFSSAEGFAYFVKSTGWATIVGKRTHGDGVSNDPVIVMLPESGMLFRFPVTAGFNPDGSINAEVGTMPDIEIEGRNKDERLKKLINSLN